MADDYGVTLKITADTSDLDKIPQKVEAVRKEIGEPVAQTVEVREERETAAPIEHPAETVEVREERETAAPVEHPGETVAVREERESAAPVEHPAEVVAVREERESAAPVEHPAEVVAVREERESAAPVEHPAEAVEVREERETAAPIEHPAETVEVREERETAAPVEHPAETVEVRQDPNPLKVEVEQPKPVKVPVEQPPPVKVDADTAPAQRGISGFFKNFRQQVSAIRSSISSVFAAAGMIGFAVTGVMAIIAGFKKLHDMINASRKAAEEHRRELKDAAYADSVRKAADAYEQLNKRLAETLRLEKERASISSSRTSATRKIEDAELDLAEQKRLARVDPSSPTAEQERATIRDEFAAKRDDLAVARAQEDGGQRAHDLRREAKVHDDEAARLRREMDGRTGRNADEARREYFQTERKADRGDEDAKKRLPELEQRLDEAIAAYRKVKESAEEHERLAVSLRRRAAEEVGAGMAEKSAATARKVARENNQTVERAKEDESRAQAQKRADEEQADFERRRGKMREAAAADEQLRDARERDALESEVAKRGGGGQRISTSQEAVYAAREDAAAEKLKAAENALAEELQKDVKDRNETRIRRAREDIIESEGALQQAREGRRELKRREVEDAQNSAQDYFARLEGVIESSRPQNRLTAMGLGDGTRGSSIEYQRSILSDMRQVVSLLRDQTDAIREQSRINGRNETAIFGE